ncbi:MAG: FAD-binding oxidoreductase [Candidatus Heimdallarchaeota archaeon]
MKEDIIFTKLVKICGTKNISKDPKILIKYSKDLSFFKGYPPLFIVWPTNTQEIENILKLANKEKFSIIPVSSHSKIRIHGDTIPHNDNCGILDLSNMNKIISIDRKNRVVMIEPGVTYADIIPKLKQKGLRLLLPLHPTGTKSVVTSALEREPIIIPRYHWDSSDPLLCTEVIFGTGDLFRTGTAAGPGTIKQQKKSGQAQANPMGPTQFSPYRLIQGSQGSLGVVTWASLKLEFSPTIQKLYHFQSNNILDLLEFQYELLKYRLCDELFILNNLNLACLMKRDPNEIKILAERLDEWNLIYVLSGRGKLAQDKILYHEGDINDILKVIELPISKKNNLIEEESILKILSEADPNPWRLRLRGGYQDIIFLSSFEKISGFIDLIKGQIPSEFGVYIQPINQGTSYQCEFDIYYDPNDENLVDTVKGKFLEISRQFMEHGAFFSRPYGIWAKEVYAHHGEETSSALKKVKKIFDPNNILNPGVLCFDN